MFSHRAQWDAPLNQLTLARRAHRGPLLDLTESNPTRVGIPYPEDELADAFSRAARAPYEPDPRGLLSAREAVASSLGCDADELILTASTSEAYAFLFKLLCDPGDELLAPAPSYPLFDHLASLESVTLRAFALEFHARWEIEHLPVTPRTRAIIVVNPNNPTGSFVTVREQETLAAAHLPIISDEVFLEYALECSGRSLIRDDLLTFTLGGLSKSAGLPHFKLAWIRVNGPRKRESLDALELIADSFLSVGTAVQVALPDILRVAPSIRDAIRARTRKNIETLRAALSPLSAVRVLPVEGGWSAVVRVPRVRSDDDLALRLLARGVVVQPGYFFDFPRDGYFVVSLLPREATFSEGVRQIAQELEG